MSRPAVIAHCDWSLPPSGRWMCVARREGVLWSLDAPELVGEPATLASRLTPTDRGNVLIGIDFPIGVPAAFASAAGLGGVREAIDRFTSHGDWRRLVAAQPDEIALVRPFYPARPGGTSRSHLEQGLGLTMSELLRRCDRRSSDRPAACAMFWTLGGNQVGKAMLSGWRELLRPHLEDGAALWPFDGDLGELLASRRTVLAETYPADSLRQIGFRPPQGWSKRRVHNRAEAGTALLASAAAVGAALTPEAEVEISSGFPASGDDGFDALVGALAMIRTVEEGLETAPRDPEVRRIEGWMLGYAAR